MSKIEGKFFYFGVRITNQICLPNAIPHKPVKITKTRMMNIFPFIVSAKTAKTKIKTRKVWMIITINCVTIWEKRISWPVMPKTRDLSKRPSFRSIRIAPDVDATDKKKITLETKRGINFFDTHRKEIKNFLFFINSRQNNPGSSKIRKVGISIAVNRFIKPYRRQRSIRAKILILSKLSCEVTERQVNITIQQMTDLLICNKNSIINICL